MMVTIGLTLLGIAAGAGLGMELTFRYYERIWKEHRIKYHPEEMEMERHNAETGYQSRRKPNRNASRR